METRVLEKYELNWVGKSECKSSVNTPTETKLNPCKEESVNWDTTGNLFIEGDNLDALKLLQEEYRHKVKMIYVDPPYNVNAETNYKDNMEQSDWLSFMYKRLSLAREMLTDDGVIFISISENQLAPLKMLCEEVFGKSHFMATLIWKKRCPMGISATGITLDHEYILCYDRKKANLRGINRTFAGYKNPDNDPRGVYSKKSCGTSLTATQRPSQYYDIKDPISGRIYSTSRSRIWRWIKPTFEKKIADNMIIFPEKGMPKQKVFKSQAKSQYLPLNSILKNVGTNNEGSLAITKLLGQRAFMYSKPVSLLRMLVEQSTQEGDIIMDIFAGSCTTAHAVMEYNVHHSSKTLALRKFIMIQKPEKNTGEYDFKTIADLGKERIRKAGNMLKQECPMFVGDIGFKVFKVG